MPKAVNIAAEDNLSEAVIRSLLANTSRQLKVANSYPIKKGWQDDVGKSGYGYIVLHTFKELRELLWRRLPDEPRFTDETLQQTVIGLLDGPGVVKELDYGTYILLAPEWMPTRKP